MTDLTFYTNPMSRGRIARWMLEETGADYETVVLDYGATMKARRLSGDQPDGEGARDQAWRHGGHRGRGDLRLSGRRLSRGGPGPAAGQHERGPYYRWLFFAAGPVEAAVTNRSLKVEPHRRSSRRFVGYGSFERDRRARNARSRPGPYICGDQFTAADVYVGSQIGWGMMFGSLEKRPIFEEYFGRLQARPAAVRAAQLDDALIAEQQQAQQPQPA